MGMPKLTVSLIKSKIQDLDSEVQLLIGKARMIRAERERAKRKAEEEKKKERRRLRRKRKIRKRRKRRKIPPNLKKKKKNLKNPTQQSLQYQVMKTQLHPKIQQKRNQKQTHQILLKRKVKTNSASDDELSEGGEEHTE